MRNNREQAIKETLKWEGGYTNHPSDPGGPTNWGITIADAKKYWKKDASASDVKAMPLDVAVSIYTTKYWKTPYYDCDKLDSGVDLTVFDFGVNSGPSRAKKYLDLSIGGSTEETINKLMDKREAFLRSLKTFPVFGKGWINRTKGIRTTALRMARNRPEKPADALKTKTGVGVASVSVLGLIYQFGVDYWPWIVGGTIVLGLLTYLYYKGKKNVGNV